VRQAVEAAADASSACRPARQGMTDDSPGHGHDPGQREHRCAAQDPVPDRVQRAVSAHRFPHGARQVPPGYKPPPAWSRRCSSSSTSRESRSRISHGPLLRKPNTSGPLWGALSIVLVVVLALEFAFGRVGADEGPGSRPSSPRRGSSALCPRTRPTGGLETTARPRSRPAAGRRRGGRRDVAVMKKGQFVLRERRWWHAGHGLPQGGFDRPDPPRAKGFQGAGSDALGVSPNHVVLTLGGDSRRFPFSSRKVPRRPPAPRVRDHSRWRRIAIAILAPALRLGIPGSAAARPAAAAANPLPPGNLPLRMPISRRRS